ncbi:MAG TPA: hypothetical protein VKQ32_16165 [Polyangia bacterium]|nr:hypothetical protein [Polyangia bacterium]
MLRQAQASRRALAAAIVLVGLIALPAVARAQSPELAMREFASGQIKKGVRSIGFGGDGATWGNYGLVYRDAGTALADAGISSYTNGNDFTFTAVGATTPQLWHGLAFYLIALSQHAEQIHLSLSSPGLGAAHPVIGSGANQALFAKIAAPLGGGFSAGVLLSYELSQFDAMTALGDPAPGSVHYATRWRPSGGAGVVWQPGPRVLVGTRVILNHDHEVRTDMFGTTEGLARSYEFRLGASVMPWAGGILDLGATELYRRNGLNGATTTVLHPNLGVEQAIVVNTLFLRAGIDETSYGGGLTVRRRPLQLDVAYIYDLGRARVGSLFGATSNSVLATLTFDMSWRPAPTAVAPIAAPHP